MREDGKRSHLYHHVVLPNLWGEAEGCGYRTEVNPMPRLQSTARILLLCTDFGATTRTKALAPALDLVKDQTIRAQAESQV